MLRGSRAFSGKIHRPFLAQVGTTKDQGLYNKPSAAVHPGALSAGTLPQYNTMQWVHDAAVDTPRSTVCQVITYHFVIIIL